MFALVKSSVRVGAMLAATLCLASCGSSGYLRVIGVNPPEATVYINGQKWNSGSKRPFEFDFSKHPRFFIQAACKDYQPRTEVFDEKAVRDLVATETNIMIHLTPR